MSLLQVCLVGSSWEAKGGARFDYLSIVNNPKVKYTRKAGPRDPMLEVMEER